MSKLPNAPLVEVVFELRWRITSREGLADVQYLYGDLYSEIKDKYPFREGVLPVELPMEMTLNRAVHRYRAEKGDYPLIQLGPGILTFNITDDKYYWDDFLAESSELLEKFCKVYPIDGKIVPAIVYIDFFPVEFSETNVHDYINKYFNVTFDQSFFQTDQNPTDFDMGLGYQIELGVLRVNLQKGEREGVEGILLQTRINGNQNELNKDILYEWLIETHDILSNLFKEMTRGDLYESFKG